MKIRSRSSVAAVAVAAVLGGGVAGTVLSGPAVAVAQEAEDETEATQRLTLEDVLDELVSDGVITQAQADAVQSAIEEARPARGFRGMRGGFHLETAAEVIGVEAADLATALRDGATIAEVAADNGVEAEAVIDALGAEATERLDQAVEDGLLTAEEADEKEAELIERITDVVNGEVDFTQRGFGRRGPGPRGFGPFGGDEPSQSATDASLDA